MKVCIAILSLLATIASVDGEALRGTKRPRVHHASFSTHHAATRSFSHHRGSMHVYHSEREAEANRRAHHAVHKSPSFGNPMIGIMTAMMGDMMKAQQGKAASSGPHQSSMRGPPGVAPRHPMPARNGRHAMPAKNGPHAMPQAAHHPAPKPMPAAEEEAEDATTYVWTQDGIDTINAKGIAGFLGNPEVGSTVTEKQTRMAKNYGKWDLAIKEKWIKPKAEEAKEEVSSEPKELEAVSDTVADGEPDSDDEMSELFEDAMDQEYKDEEKDDASEEKEGASEEKEDASEEKEDASEEEEDA